MLDRREERKKNPVHIIHRHYIKNQFSSVIELRTNR